MLRKPPQCYAQLTGGRADSFAGCAKISMCFLPGELAPKYQPDWSLEHVTISKKAMSNERKSMDRRQYIIPLLEGKHRGTQRSREGADVLTSKGRAHKNYRNMHRS